MVCRQLVIVDFISTHIERMDSSFPLTFVSFCDTCLSQEVRNMYDTLSQQHQKERSEEALAVLCAMEENEDEN